MTTLNKLTYSGWEIKEKDVDHYRQMECRKNFSGSQVLLIVGLEGFNTEYDKREPKHAYSTSTKAYNVRISMNKAAWLTWDDYNSINRAVHFCKQFLETV